MDALQIKKILLEELQREFEEATCEKLLSNLGLVLKANQKTNLTSVDDMEGGIYLHIVDSLVCLSEFESAQEGKYLDLGTGGGFPGIPLALVTGRKGVLLDSIKKKTDLVQSFVHTLNLDEQIEVVCSRSEDYALEHPGEFTVVTARAVAKLSVLMELASPLLAHGGRLIALKAQPEEEEIEHANEIGSSVGMKCVSTRESHISDGKGNKVTRTILVLEKVSEPTIQLPRKPGRATKRPL